MVTDNTDDNTDDNNEAEKRWDEFMSAKLNKMEILFTQPIR